MKQNTIRFFGIAVMAAAMVTCASTPQAGQQAGRQAALGPVINPAEESSFAAGMRDYRQKFDGAGTFFREGWAITSSETIRPGETSTTQVGRTTVSETRMTHSSGVPESTITRDNAREAIDRIRAGAAAQRAEREAAEAAERAEQEAREAAEITERLAPELRAVGAVSQSARPFATADGAQIAREFVSAFAWVNASQVNTGNLNQLILERRQIIAWTDEADQMFTAIITLGRDDAWEDQLSQAYYLRAYMSQLRIRLLDENAQKLRALNYTPTGETAGETRSFAQINADFAEAARLGHRSASEENRMNFIMAHISETL